MPTIKGDTNPVPQGLAYEFDPRDGLQVSNPLRGEFNSMLGYSAVLRSAGIAHSFVQDGPEAEIVIRGSRLNENDTSEEQPQDEWVVEANSLAFSLYEHPKALFLEKTYPDILSFIKADVEASSNGTLTRTPYSEKLQGVYDFSDPSHPLIADQLLRRMITEGTQYNRESYKLVHVQSISDRFSSAIADVSVLRIYTYAQLESEITDSSLATPCPARLRSKLQSAFSDLAPDQDFYNVLDYKWGFLKSPSHERSVANSKIQITTEYTLELWSLFAYAEKQ